MPSENKNLPSENRASGAAKAVVPLEVRKYRSRPVDITFGIVTLAICFVADPGLLSRQQSIAIPLYITSFIACSALYYWHYYDCSPRAHAFLSGIFGVAALISGAISIPLLPLSIVLIIILIGLLSLTTIVTFFVYARAALRAARLGKCARRFNYQFAGAMLMILAGLAAYAPHYLLSRSLARLYNSAEASPIERRLAVESEARKLVWIRLLLFSSNWVESYRSFEPRWPAPSHEQARQLFQLVEQRDLDPLEFRSD